MLETMNIARLRLQCVTEQTLPELRETYQRANVLL